jgi:hypothetical protein
MSERNDEANTPSDGQPSIPTLKDVIEAIKKLLYAAVQKDRPEGIDKEVTVLYKVVDGSQRKTDALVAACLSDWQSFIKDLQCPDHQPLNADKAAILLIHRTFNRWRRKKYRDDQSAEQVDRANVKDKDGEFLPFDPAMPAWRQEAVKFSEEIIAIVVAGFSPRDRMIVELLYFEEMTGKEIVRKLKRHFLESQFRLPWLQEFGRSLTMNSVDCGKQNSPSELGFFC